jgi:hypothetical protein
VLLVEVVLRLFDILPRPDLWFACQDAQTLTRSFSFLSTTAYVPHCQWHVWSASRFIIVTLVWVAAATLLSHRYTG